MLKMTSRTKAAILFITSPNGSLAEILHRRCAQAATSGVTSVTPDSGPCSLLALRRLVNRLFLPRHVIHQQILAERVWSGEVGFASTHLRYFLDELDEAVIRCQHEGVDQDAGALAF